MPAGDVTAKVWSDQETDGQRERESQTETRTDSHADRQTAIGVLSNYCYDCFTVELDTVTTS